MYLIHGSTPKEIIQKYAVITGRPALPPPWTFGLWLSTSFTTEYDENTVNSFLDGMEKRDIHTSVFHFDCFWMKGFEWCDFKFDEDMFPDAKGQIARIKKRGNHVSRRQYFIIRPIYLTMTFEIDMLLDKSVYSSRKCYLRRGCRGRLFHQKIRWQPVAI